MSQACSESCHERAVDHVTSGQWIMSGACKGVMSQACSGSCHDHAVDLVTSLQWIMSRVCSRSCHERVVDHVRTVRRIMKRGTKSLIELLTCPKNILIYQVLPEATDLFFIFCIEISFPQQTFVTHCVV